MAKIVALDVLTKILKQVYNKTKEYTNGQIKISLESLSSSIGKNSENIATLKNTTITQQKSIDGLSSSVTALQSELTTAKSNVADLQSKVYDYLGNDEIDKVFEKA